MAHPEKERRNSAGAWRVLRIVLVLGACSFPWGECVAQAQGTAVTGKYRNLFAEAGHSPAEIRARVDGAFQQLFHGDTATQTVYYVTRARRFVEALWKTPVPSGTYRCYDGMWYMMSFLHLSGNYRVWAPK